MKSSLRLSVFVLTSCAVASFSWAQVTDANNESFKNADTIDREEAQRESRSESEQEVVKNGRYEFTIDTKIPCSAVCSQDRTGTCWCYASASFVESELMRRDEGKHNLSEMFVAKNIYREKALNYVLRQGDASFGQGALAHDYLNAIEKYGIVPEEVYSGKKKGQAHDHGEMVALLKGIVEATVERDEISPRWQEAFDRVLDVYLGESPFVFHYRGKTWTPLEFADSIEFDADDYVGFTSYTHHPFLKKFVLEVPDNFSNGSFMNVPIDDVVEILDNAIDSGYSALWDGDVSEDSFSANRGIAVLPADKKSKGLRGPVEQLEVTQELRQKRFLSYATTDDHLMHVVGRATDQFGIKYYLLKNSWGEIGPHKGYVYMSEAYVRLHTLAIILNRDCLDSRFDR